MTERRVAMSWCRWTVVHGSAMRYLRSKWSELWAHGMHICRARMLQILDLGIRRLGGLGYFIIFLERQVRFRQLSMLRLLVLNAANNSIPQHIIEQVAEVAMLR